MNDLEDMARISIAEGRAERFNSLVVKRDTQRSRSEFSLVYHGYRDGQHWGRSPDGGRMPIKATSPGTIKRGQMFVGMRASGTGAIYATWMP